MRRAARGKWRRKGASEAKSDEPLVPQPGYQRFG